MCVREHRRCSVALQTALPAIVGSPATFARLFCLPMSCSRDHELLHLCGISVPADVVTASPPLCVMVCSEALASTFCSTPQYGLYPKRRVFRKKYCRHNNCGCLHLYSVHHRAAHRKMPRHCARPDPTSMRLVLRMGGSRSGKQKNGPR
jgi:hypothetical protein